MSPVVLFSRFNQLLLGKATEAFAQNLVALHDVDKRMRIDVVKHRAQLNHVGTVESDVEHLALGALVKAAARDERSAALDVVDDVVTHLLGIVGDDEHRLIALHTIDHEVNHLTLDEDDDNGVNGQTNVTKGNKGAQGDNAINNHDECTQRDLGVLVNDHRDDIRTATSSSRAENQTDGKTIYDSGNHSIEEIVGMEPTAMMRNLNHRLDH